MDAKPKIKKSDTFEDSIQSSIEEALQGLPSADKVRIPDKTYFRIGEVARILGVKPYVLRYWESEFPMISPQKSSTGQRVYRRSDVETVLMIKHLLYSERYSIEGARKRIRELRKEGELKTFKQETVAENVEQPAQPAPSVFDAERFEEMKQLARELKLMSFEPVHPLFRY